MFIRGPSLGGTTSYLLIPAITGLPDLVITLSNLVRASHLNVFNIYIVTQQK